MELIHAAGITQSMLLALYFFHRRKEPGNLLESLLLLVVAATIGVGYLYGSGLILQIPHLSRIGFTLMSLIGPLFLFSWKLRNSGKLHWKDALWCLAPLGITLYLIPFHLSSLDYKVAYLKQDLVQIHFDCVVILYVSLSNNLLSMTLTIYLLYRGDRQSMNGGGFSTGRKAYYFLPLTALIVVAAMSATDPNLMNSGLFSAAGSLVVLGRSYVLLYNRESTGVSHALYPPGERYRKSLLPEELVRSKGKEIELYMEEDCPYLEPDFQLPELARKVELSTVQTSQVLNRYFETGFIPLVQRYRVEHAKKLLSSRNSSFSVLDIAMESGFNSKSAFNASFRKYAGISPTEFRTLQSTGQEATRA